MVWELFLAALSFVFFKSVKFLIRGLLSVYYLVAKSRASRWKLASADLLELPGALPVIMTIGPRWNVHAIVAAVGPIGVEKSLTVNVAAAQRSARVWNLVVSTFPRYRTVATIGSSNAPFAGSSVEIPVRRGTYWIALRYYHWGESVELPSLNTDGAERIASIRVPPGVNEFYHRLARGSNLFYLCLHYYVFVLLRYRRYFPAAFVDREFLPLGNPETHFYFGALRAGERLSIQTDPGLLESYDVYGTIYNRASFPVAWFQVTDRDFASAESAANCVYLVRIHKNRAIQGDFDKKRLRIFVTGRACR